MLLNVECQSCKKPGRARYNRGIRGISYTYWLCPNCRKIQKEKKD